MNLIEQGKFYKTDIFIDINANIYYDKVFKLEKDKIIFVKTTKEEIYELKNSIVFPSFVNAHTHLELTNIKKSNLNFSSFVDWVISLIKEKRGKNDDFFLNSYLLGKNLLKKYGCFTFGNILSPNLFGKISKSDIYFNFVEIIEYNMDNIDKINIDYPKISPHSFFSVHPDLINKILATKKPISMHFFESKEEYEYLILGKGDIPDRLYKFTGLTPLKYNLNYFAKFLKKAKNIQLVHLSNVPEELKPIILEKKYEIFYTLCPRSNEKFGFKSPYYFFIKNKIPFSLGTDSLCSNDDLNVFNEAIFILNDLLDDFPKESLAKLLFLSLTKFGYQATFNNVENYIFLENIGLKKDFNFYNFLNYLLSFVK